MLDVQYALTPDNSVGEQQVLDMLTKKTGALLEYAAWCGATIGLAVAHVDLVRELVEDEIHSSFLPVGAGGDVGP